MPIYSPPQVDRIWGIWGSYDEIPEAIFYLLKLRGTISTDVPIYGVRMSRETGEKGLLRSLKPGYRGLG